MDSVEGLRRQMRFALVGMLSIVLLGIIGYMLIEGMTLLEAVYLTVITLTTVGYGDDYAKSDEGRIFTIFLIIFGFGLVAYGLQAIATLLFSPEIRELRIRRKTEKLCQKLGQHYIICGTGDMVDQTITYLLQSVRLRLAFYDEKVYGPIDNFLDRIFGDDELGYYPKTRAVVRSLYLTIIRLFMRVGTMLDMIVVVTENTKYARHLRENGFLVVEGNPTNDETLLTAGVRQASAMMVMLPDDTAALLTVLTARSHNNELYITAATMQEQLAEKILRVGANNVIRTYELCGLFLNNVTLRPTVYDFFHALFFDQTLQVQSAQITLHEGTVWIGKRIGELALSEAYDAHIMAIYRQGDSKFIVAPGDSYVLSQGEILVIAVPTGSVSMLQLAARENVKTKPNIIWQRPTPLYDASRHSQAYTLAQAEADIREMSKHSIVLGNDEVAHNAIQQLDPSRPFVVICEGQTEAERLLGLGFRVVMGGITDEDTLARAGAGRALAIMISLDNEADTVLAVINARSLSERLLITATANSDEHIHKIERAGADRVFNPFSIAAQFMLLTATRPVVSKFFQYVLYNRADQIETTELYMDDSSAWIGKSIADLQLVQSFQIHVIGVRQVDGTFRYAPPEAYEIRAHEVLIIVVPMAYANELHIIAHGNASKQPDTLRNTSRAIN
jgi:voltage-gated potassium channel